MFQLAVCDSIARRIRSFSAPRAALTALAAGLCISTLSAPVMGDAVIGLLELDGKITDRAKNPSPLMGGSKGHMHMPELIKALDKAAKDPEIKGLVVRVVDAELTRSNIDELGKAMQAFRAKGKKIHVFAENYGPAEVMLGCKADEVIIQSGGGVMLPGVYMEEMFLADALKWVGITPDFVQVGDYKGAMEMMANSKPSKAWDENINGLLDQMYANMRSELKAGRKLDDSGIDKALETAWLASDTDAKKVGLVDSIIDLPELDAHLKKAYGQEITWDDELLPSDEQDMAQMMNNPFAMFSMLMQKPSYEPKRDTIAVLHIDGAIIDGESQGGGLFGGDSSVGSRTLRRALKDIEENDKIKGLVVRIDSPGGSAIASEMIWQGIRRVAEGGAPGSGGKGKPVFISVGSMAASGGYYCLVAGSKVYVNPTSIVGSIGVVGGKMALGGLMEKLHVNTVGRARGPRAAMFSSMSPWSEQDKAIVRKKMTETYDLFTSRVTAGRKGIDLSKTAEGRLFMGEKAVQLGMADALGSLKDAVTDLASTSGLREGAYDVMDYPAPKSLQEMLEEAFGRFGASATAPQGVITGENLIGQITLAGAKLINPAAARSLSTSLEAIMTLRNEPVILATPRVLIWGW
jgi:protease-4